MTLTESQILVATNRERPTHGYAIGQLLYDNIDKQTYELVTRGPHVWRQTRHPLTMKEGKCEFNSGSAVRGEGILADLAHLGTTPAFNAMDANGSANTFATGSSVAQNGGVGILRTIATDFQGFTRNSFLPYYFIKHSMSGRTAGDMRYYGGFIRSATGSEIADTPMLNTQGGILVGFNSTDTEWNVWHSNGDGVTPVSKTPLVPSIPIPSATTNYRIEMTFTTATNIIITVYSGLMAVLGSATINTNVLPSGKSMNWLSALQNALVTPSKNLTCYALVMRTIL